MKSDATIKAIKTQYKGQYYRSRTEARWAVFFDYLQLEFKYEPEGYDLGKDGWYLPDFYIPSLDCFIEIKPDVPVEGRESPTEALAAHTGKSVYTFYGSPQLPIDSFDGGVCICVDCVYKELSGAMSYGWDDGYHLCVCPSCGRAGIEFDGRADRIDCDCIKSVHGDKGYNANDERIVNAAKRAMNEFRSSRRKAAQ